MPRQKPGLRRRRDPWLRVLLLVLVLSGLAILLRQGLMPVAVNPLPSVELDKKDQWLLDWRLAKIRSDPALCARTLQKPYLDARPISDSPMSNGCGWQNAVAVYGAGGARVYFGELTCEMAVALALWIQNDVQPLARETFGRPVRSIQTFGSYSCRNIIGDHGSGLIRSQHASANAMDIAGFTLTDGRSITVAADWRADTPPGRFLRAVHAGACKYFRVVLSPDYNAVHSNHLHLDRGPFSACR
jgi:hypothetical protein